MHGYYADEILLVLPLFDGPGLRLRGEVLADHRGPLALAVAGEAARTDTVVLDLTGVRFISHGALDFLAVLARRITPPQHLLLRARPDLALRARLAERGHDTIATLRLEEIPYPPAPDAEQLSAASRTAEGTTADPQQTAVVPGEG
ncbi:STAS domain-containing protein [Streptomyces sp. NPDC059900]|uniref:STAS domain-containing protein n=1 Tax=Streptomyces sp. NPDC059900 TaxID=3155816 RepID=UPI0034499E3A